MNCIFCKIAAGEIPSAKVYEDESVLAFKDLNPAAPVHVLVIPKAHIESLDCVNGENIDLVSKVISAVPVVAKA
ncbi:MAG: HIT domain-containing protein, partial [Clostridia bacterium]|nr:HIT domain-containing protein [Clostridia bacterium]